MAAVVPGHRYAAQFFAVNATDMMEASLDGRALWTEGITPPPAGAIIHGPVLLDSIYATIYVVGNTAFVMDQDGIPFATVGMGAGLEAVSSPCVVGRQAYVLAKYTSPSAGCAVVALQVFDRLSDKLYVAWTFNTTCPATPAAGNPPASLTAVQFASPTPTGGGGNTTAVLVPCTVDGGPGLLALQPGAAAATELWRHQTTGSVVSVAAAGTYLNNESLPGLTTALFVHCRGTPVLEQLDAASGKPVATLDLRTVLASADVNVSSAHVLRADNVGDSGALVMAVTSTHSSGDAAAASVQSSVVAVATTSRPQLLWNVPLPQWFCPPQDGYTGQFAVLTPLNPDGVTAVVASSAAGIIAMGVQGA